jgi:hypothetical protein
MKVQWQVSRIQINRHEVISAIGIVEKLGQRLYSGILGKALP